MYVYESIFPSILPPKKVKLINNVIIFSGSRCSNRVFVLLNFGQYFVYVCKKCVSNSFWVVFIVDGI